jgi:LAO/AO transport system kinase
MGSVQALALAVRRGEPMAVARAITMAERRHPSSGQLQAALAGADGSGYTVGITGPPGVGKSTVTSALIGQYRSRGLRVGVLAIDPSSPVTGGALLGDRLRMRDHTLDDGVYIRSMASAGELGGLATAAYQALRVLQAAGYDMVLLETVGVGQSEIDVVTLADTVVLLVAPGAGDEIQASKAGIGEVGDLIAVNKSDQPGADQAVRDYVRMVRLDASGSGPPAWRRPVVRTIASQGQVTELVRAIEAHREFLGQGPQRDQRRRSRAIAEIQRAALAILRSQLESDSLETITRQLASQVMTGESAVETAAERLADAASATRTAPGKAGSIVIDQNINPEDSQ